MGSSGCPSRPDRVLGVLLRRVVKLVDHVAVDPQREGCVVAELARDVNHRAAGATQAAIATGSSGDASEFCQDG